MSRRWAVPASAEVLLVLPPTSDVTTGYPSTAYLTGYLRSQGISAAQCDWSLELTYRLFSAEGLQRVEEALLTVSPRCRGEAADSFLAAADRYRATVRPVLDFLRGADPTLAVRISRGDFLPSGPRLREGLSALGLGRDPQFGPAGEGDRARYLASLYLCDVEEAIREVDPSFRLNAYAERLASSPESFQPLRDAVEDEGGLIGGLIDELVAECLPPDPPAVVGISIPFPGNVFGAFRVARRLRHLLPETVVAIGGGWVNTELRRVSAPEVFDYVDCICLDAGERPLECVVEYARGARDEGDLLRTFVRAGSAVEFKSSPTEFDVPFAKSATPVYEGLPLDRYIAWMPGLSRVHRIWAGRWNKLTLAHGCYWRKCAFCDISLDYIQRYEAQGADRVVDRVLELIEETGTSGFHWVDEAAPPALLRRVAEQLLARKVEISWWGMVRFEKAFTPELTELLAAAGCVMLSGGLEVASDRILRLMRKGVSIDQVAKVTQGMSAAGIQVHAFLMYGFPGETAQEAVDSLEVVRQLFAQGCLQSAFWHRFVATVHSPIGIDPEAFGVSIPRRPEEDPPPEGLFATDVLAHLDPVEADRDLLGRGLERAVLAYREGTGLDAQLSGWFDGQVPPSTVAPDLISSTLESDGHALISGAAR